MRKCGKKDLCFQTEKYENLMCSTNRAENQQYGKYLHLETVPTFLEQGDCMNTIKPCEWKVNKNLLKIQILYIYVRIMFRSNIFLNAKLNNLTLNENKIWVSANYKNNSNLVNGIIVFYDIVSF